MVYSEIRGKEGFAADLESRATTWSNVSEKRHEHTRQPCWGKKAKRAKGKTRNVNRCRPADGYGKPLHSRFRWPSTTLLPSPRPRPLFSFTIGLARGKIVMYDDETEVFNLANRCLETFIPDPKTWELLAIPGIEGSGGGEGMIHETKETLDTISFTCSK